MRKQAKNLPYTYRYEKGVPPVMKKDRLGTGKRIVPKIGRNEPCPCGSKLKFKKCCQDWPTFARKQQEIKKANEAREAEAKKAEKNAGEPPASPGDESCEKCGGSGTYGYESSSEAYYSVYCECLAGKEKQKEFNASQNITSGGES